MTWTMSREELEQLLKDGYLLDERGQRITPNPDSVVRTDDGEVEARYDDLCTFGIIPRVSEADDDLDTALLVLDLENTSDRWKLADEANALGRHHLAGLLRSDLPLRRCPDCGALLPKWARCGC